MELKTDTNGRVTISDSFIKMYPDDPETGNPTYAPKLQLGYDSESPNSNPVIIFGTGSGATYPEDMTEPDGSPSPLAGQYKTTDSMGYSVRYGQALMYKTATGITVGAAGWNGLSHWLELRAAELEGDPLPAGLYYCCETATGELDEHGDPVKQLHREKFLTENYQ